MAKGVPLTETQYYQIKGMLKSGIKTRVIEEQTHIGAHTISRVNTTDNFEEFNTKRAERTKKANASIRNKIEITEPEQMSEQDIHDIAREIGNIKSILLKMAEAWGVKF